MKIKNKNKISRFPDFTRDFFRKRRSTVAWALRLGAVLVTVVMFFSVFRYGIHLKEAGYTTYFNNALQKLVKFDFSFTSNYARGSLAEFDEIALDIKFKHLLRLQYLREQSMKGGLILPEYKNEEFPAKLTHNGKSINVKIGLTGMVAKSHLRDPAKWSFVVKVKGNDTFKGMKRFAMLLPSTRGYLTDWLGFELMKDRGLMGMRVDFVNISFNGKSTGIYYMEERFDKYLIENNRMREGIIFKINGGLEAYRESKLMANPATRDQLLLIKRMWQQVNAGTLPPGKLFDLKKMAQVFVICDIMNNKHPLAGQNLRYYFNPITGLAEPIAREWEELHDNDPLELALFLEKPRQATRHFRFERLPFIRMIYDNLEFKRHYIREAAEVSQTAFLDQLLERNEDKLNALLKKVYRTWPFYDDPTKFLYENQRYMRSVLFPDTEQLSADFNGKNDNLISIHLQNQQYMPLEVSYLTWRDSVRFYPETPVELDSKVKVPKGDILSFNFKIPEGVRWDEAMAGELAAHYNLLGLEPGAKSIPVLFRGDNASVAEDLYIGSKTATYGSFSFIEENETDNTVTIPAGSWAISRDLVIPPNKRLEIAPGAQIELANQARIISYSPVFCQGSEQDPIRIHSAEETGSGFLVIEAKQHSFFSHTTFDQLSAAEQQGGAILFYKSPVTISSCIFSNNKRGEALLRIVRSEVAIDQALFSNITANAVDGEFCTGSISNSSFANIGKNAISFRGTELLLSHLYLNAIAGKGINAREESEVEARWIELNNTATGFACADGSRIILADAYIRNSQIGIVAFQDNKHFGPAAVDAQRIEWTEAATPFLVEKNSSITLNGQSLPENTDNVEDILLEAPPLIGNEQPKDL